jgi:predicted AAA+ superfamily ATPase
MYRLFQEKLEQWKVAPNRKPLIVRGARQVGKSYTIVQFGKMSFPGKTHVVDLEKYPDLHGIFKRDLDPVRIVGELEIILNTRITPGQDLLFFDEIQAEPRAIMALRYFYEDLPGLHVIAAGSLLEFAMKDISFPVGRVHLMTMNPMNFYEFLVAGDKIRMAEIIRAKPERLADTIHAEILQVLRQYMFAGGMPECVKAWLGSGSMADVFEIQADLAATYRQDFSKYAPHADKRALNNVLSAVAKRVGHQIKYTQLSDEFSGPTNKKAFDLLQLARVIHKISATSPASLPLEASASDKKFKALTVDIGLLHSLNDFRVGREYGKSDLLAIFDGALAEQFVGQELISCGRENPYYWSREAKSSSAEVDYLIVRKGRICPIEVKGGASGKLRSLHLLLQQFRGIEQAFVLSTAPFGTMPDQKLTFLPLYYAFSLMDEDGQW